MKCRCAGAHKLVCIKCELQTVLAVAHKICKVYEGRKSYALKLGPAITESVYVHVVINGDFEVVS